MKKGEFKELLNNYREIVDNFLKRYLDGLTDAPSTLKKAMEYSLMAGGKRIRPILCMVCAKLFDESKDILPFACALELIHTYSLIHDDLPAMDDDDYRRGMLTSHKVFGEAMAILAGDALLTDGFRMMLECDVECNLLHRAIKEMSFALGPCGMVGGQVVDMELTGKKKCEMEQLRHMHSLKTGKFIESACVSGAILGGGSEIDIDRIREYGKMIGLGFQIADDILDVEGDETKMGKPVGSDEKQGKCTYPSLLGLEASKKLGWETINKALSSIKGYNSPYAIFLKALARYIMERTE